MEMKKLEHNLLTENYTTVYHEEDYKFNAPHHFTVFGHDESTEGTVGKVLAEISFQEGPIKENGVNGVNNEDLLVMVLTRLESFQNSPYRCRENALAITAIEEALLRLRQRTMGREKRGVEGTHKI
jgi:hypothetical protein